MFTVKNDSMPISQMVVFQYSQRTQPLFTRPIRRLVPLRAQRERWDRIKASSSERDQKILLLRSMGCSFVEISGQLQIDECTVRRAMKRLINQLGNSP